MLTHFELFLQAGSALFSLSRCVSHRLFYTLKHRTISWGRKISFTGCFIYNFHLNAVKITI